MAYAYFSKVEIETTIQTLEASANQQKMKKCKALEYNPIAEVRMEADEFSSFSKDIARPLQCDISYCASSVVNLEGVLNCIIIKCNGEKIAIAAYTGGRTIPLYAAPIYMDDTNQDGLAARV